MLSNLYNIMNRKANNLLFDILLFIFIFPYLLRYRSYFIYSKLVIFTIFACHLLIWFQRYVFNVNFKWPLWAECISIILGLILIYDSLFTKNNIIFLLGLIISIAHLKKIFYPNKPYYF